MRGSSPPAGLKPHACPDLPRRSSIAGQVSFTESRSGPVAGTGGLSCIFPPLGTRKLIATGYGLLHFEFRRPPSGQHELRMNLRSELRRPTVQANSPLGARPRAGSMSLRIGQEQNAGRWLVLLCFFLLDLGAEDVQSTDCGAITVGLIQTTLPCSRSSARPQVSIRGYPPRIWAFTRNVVDK
jgi:hypothetical protein